MRNIYVHKSLTCFIAAVWLVSGLFCKVLQLVPRHEQIVARILGESYSKPITTAIGWLEIAMAIWVLSGIKPRWNAFFQIATVAAMNLLEFILAPDLLLWGRFNAVFALLFILIIYYSAYKLRRDQ